MTDLLYYHEIDLTEPPGKRVTYWVHYPIGITIRFPVNSIRRNGADWGSRLLFSEREVEDRK